jgi:hypothetical protein
MLGEQRKQPFALWYICYVSLSNLLHRYLAIDPGTDIDLSDSSMIFGSASGVISWS